MGKGYEMASSQFLLQSLPSTVSAPVNKTKINFRETGNEYILSGKNFEIVFDTKNAMLQRYSRNGETVLQQGPVPAFYRAPTDNILAQGLIPNCVCGATPIKTERNLRQHFRN